MAGFTVVRKSSAMMSGMVSGNESYLQPYRDSVAVSGTGFYATLWANPASQRIRFKVFTQLCDLTGKRLLDAGCSRGDLAVHLIEQGIAFDHYVGIDGVDKVIDFASSRDLPRCEFHAGDFLADADLLTIGRPQILLISGTLNTMTFRQVIHSLDMAWNAVEEAMIFNFLSDRCGPGATPQVDPARRHGTSKLIDWALKHTWSVQFRQDYFPHGHDATIMMRKVS